MGSTPPHGASLSPAPPAQEGGHTGRRWPCLQPSSSHSAFVQNFQVTDSMVNAGEHLSARAREPALRNKVVLAANPSA